MENPGVRQALAESTLEIYNLLGSRVISRKITQELIRVNVRGFSPDIYFVQIKANNRVFTN